MLRSFVVFQLLLFPLAGTAALMLRAGGGAGALRGMRALLLGAVVASLWVGLPAAGPRVSSVQPGPELATESLPSPTAMAAVHIAPPPRLPAWPTWPLALLPLAAWACGAAALRRRVRDTPLLRRVRGVEIRAGSSSWSAWLPGRRVVVLAPHASRSDQQLTLRHELQHHRQGDPQWAWVLFGLQVLCAFNPAVHLLARSLRALEELACDAALMARGTSAKRYGAALLRAATPRKGPLAIAFHTPTLLEGRLTLLKKANMTKKEMTRRTATARWLLALGLITCSGMAVAAELRVPVVQSTAAFEVPAHPVVDSARGRLDQSMAGFLSEGLQRYPQWAPMVHAELDAWGLPPELAAVPLIESGYQNLGSYTPGSSAAPGVPGKGLWMFIPSTARTYGLQVNETQDQRLDAVLETRAAAALLSDLYQDFGDWGLALAGYNQGATHVRNAMEVQQTEDWGTLVERGALNNYSALVFAASERLPE